jgi:hypothetical protein
MRGKTMAPIYLRNDSTVIDVRNDSTIEIYDLNDSTIVIYNCYNSTIIIYDRNDSAIVILSTTHKVSLHFHSKLIQNGWWD